MKNIKTIVVKDNVSVIQTVTCSAIDQFAAMLLRNRELTKEEKLMSMLLSECDDTGKVLVHRHNKTILINTAGITEYTYYSYIRDWKKRGIIKTSGPNMYFDCWVNRKTAGFLVSR